MRLPPFVYGNNGHGFASMAIGAAKRDGSAFFIGMPQYVIDNSKY